MAELAYLTLLGNWKVEHHAHHLVNHRVELVLRDVDLIEAAREIHLLVAAKHIDLAQADPRNSRQRLREYFVFIES